MKLNWMKKSIALAMLSALLLQPCAAANDMLVARAAEETAGASEAASSTEYSVERLATGYTKVSAEYKAPMYEYKGEKVEFQIDKVLDAAYSGMLTAENKGYANDVVQMTVGDTIRLTVEVPETALYWINFDYLSNDDSILPIELSFKVDGEYPFYENSEDFAVLGMVCRFIMNQWISTFLFIM